MHFVSTNNSNSKVSLREAVLSGLAPDKGLYLPENIEPLPSKTIAALDSLSFQEIGFEMAKRLLGTDEISAPELRSLIEQSFNFPIVLKPLGDFAAHRLHTLELFHGPTAAFKDFGARFMAAIMSHFLAGDNQPVRILVATSGDTGGAVANAFLGKPGIEVYILYPKGRVSDLQEKQLTTPGCNVYALCVDGSFDDCQRLVKTAFQDQVLSQRLRLSSANSINIARLIPQSFYHMYAAGKLQSLKQPIVISVPSGNFGNLCAGLIAKRMGAPITRFVAATNANDVIPRYLTSGTYAPGPSARTISNAMDVGDPSNFARMRILFSNSLPQFQAEMCGHKFSDQETLQAVSDCLSQYKYLLDPHGAVGLLGLKTCLAQEFQKQAAQGVFLETAHPGKFLSELNGLVPSNFELPASLSLLDNDAGRSFPLKNDFAMLKQFLLAQR